MQGHFRFGGGDSRTTVIGATGSGKSVCGAWMLAHQRFDKRPWIVFDYKREELFDQAGFPPIRPLDLGKLPNEPGLYLVTPIARRDDDAVEDFLWRVWERGNIGLYIDETYLMPDRSAFPAIYQQGRSLRIPVIACTQRPVAVPRPIFSEAGFFAVFHMADKRDYAVVEGFVPGDLSAPMPPFHWWWYDVQRRVLLHMGPVPTPKYVAALLASRLPRIEPRAWHPFSITARPTSSRLKV